MLCHLTAGRSRGRSIFSTALTTARRRPQALTTDGDACGSGFIDTAVRDSFPPRAASSCVYQD